MNKWVHQHQERWEKVVVLVQWVHKLKDTQREKPRTNAYKKSVPQYLARGVPTTVVLPILPDAVRRYHSQSHCPLKWAMVYSERKEINAGYLDTHSQKRSGDGTGQAREHKSA